jgi:hypothetical protein
MTDEGGRIEMRRDVAITKDRVPFENDTDSAGFNR